MRVLAIKLSSLGDLFHALPAVHCLREQLGAEIDWVTQPEYAELVGCFSDVSRAIVFPRRNAWSGAASFLGELRAFRYDLVVDFQGLLKSAMVCAAARSGRKIGPSFHREGAGFFYTETAGVRDKSRHAVEENLDVVRLLGLEAGDPVFAVAFPPVPRLAVKRPALAVAPATRWVTKAWPMERFVDAIRRVRVARDCPVFLLGAANDRALCDRMADQAGGAASGIENLAGRLTLVETGGLLRDVSVLLTNDSGPMHMAAAVGTPTVAVFGPTDPTRTGPYGAGHRVLRGGLPCQPCFSRECPLGTAACLTAVTAEQAAEAVLASL